jgi:quercetin 2,3-dioxygenase
MLIRKVDGQVTIEGGGFTVKRPFPTRALDHVDPFLLLDEAGPIEHKPGDEDGLPDHPHRGFETLTYILEGETESHDSTGFRDNFYAGDVEWTTAGRGIVHGGGPTEHTRVHGGAMRGFQIWVNLPKAQKLIAPKSTRIAAKDIPVITDDRFSVKVIGGNAHGVVGPLSTTWPITYLHYTLEPDAVITLTVTDSDNAMLYVFEGGVRIDDEELAAGQLGILSSGNTINFSNASDGKTQLLLLAGAPINEPIARYGPFVMNTREEVFQAFDHYNAGKFV